MVDTNHLAHYVLPKKIRIKLFNKDGEPFTEFSVPIIIEYGYYVPPLTSDKSGQITITRELMKEAEYDHRSTGIMDYKRDDYSLNRYVVIKVLTRKEATKLANGRMSSPWLLSNLEKRLYGSKQELTAAFIPVKDLNPIYKYIDLSDSAEDVQVDIMITTKEQLN